MKDFFLSYRNFVGNASPWYKLLFLLFLVLTFFMVAGAVGLVTVSVLFKLNMHDISSIMDHPDAEGLPIIQILQAVQTISMFIIPAFLAAFFFGQHTLSYLRLNKKPAAIITFAAILSMIAWIPVINFTAAINSRLDLPKSMDFIENEMKVLRDNYNQLTNLFLQTKSAGGLISNLLIMAMLPAIGEELLFRGIFQRLFSEWTKNIHLGIIIASLLFSFFHFEFFGFLPRFLLGLFFGYLLIWTASIWIPIFAHFTNNAIIICYYFFALRGNETPQIDEMGARADCWLWISLGTGIALTAFIYYKEKSNRITNQ
jgi:uncharacterized protein